MFEHLSSPAAASIQFHVANPPDESLSIPANLGVYYPIALTFILWVYEKSNPCIKGECAVCLAGTSDKAAHREAAGSSDKASERKRAQTGQNHIEAIESGP